MFRTRPSCWYDRGRSPRRRRGWAAIATVIAVAASTGCNPIFGEDAGGVRHATANDFGRQVGNAPFQYRVDGGTTTVSGPVSETSVSLRELFWSTDDPYYADQEACVTFEDTANSVGGTLIQPGIAMRIAPSDGDGTGVKAIAIEQNVWAGVTWVFWVHTWDSGVEKHDAFTERFDVSEALGVTRHRTPPPWHMCAQTEGVDLRFKIWTGDRPAPSWDDQTHVFATELPPEWNYAGYSGAYIGHLESGQSARFSGHTTIPLCLAEEMVDTPGCQAELVGSENGADPTADPESRDQASGTEAVSSKTRMLPP